MALINRFSRLFTADMHAVMDRMEEPEILLKQALRDMEAAVAASEQRCRQLRQQGLALETALDRAADRLGDLAGELQVCLEADNDDLARAVIKRKLHVERQQTALEDELAHVAREQNDQDRLHKRQKTELFELRQKADVFELAQSDAVGIDTACLAISEAEVSEADIEVALLKEKQRRERS